VQSRLLLDVVVGESSAILKLLSGENQALLVRGNALLVLNLRLNIVDSIGGFNLKGDGLSGEGLDEDLHASTETKDEMQGGFLLDVIVGQRASILKLLSSKDQTLLIRRNSFLVLNLGLDVVDGVRRFDLKSDGLAGKGLHEDLHVGG